uniref:gluc_A04_0005 Binder n=1 Tax=synthetic construct TaxID=32630 RepID=UPI002B41871B|nr:Chain A, gluc_A04_0005 Binder [synthetic construct]
MSGMLDELFSLLNKMFELSDKYRELRKELRKAIESGAPEEELRELLEKMLEIAKKLLELTKELKKLVEDVLKNNPDPVERAKAVLLYAVGVHILYSESSELEVIAERLGFKDIAEKAKEIADKARELKEEVKRKLREIREEVPDPEIRKAAEEAIEMLESNDKRLKEFRKLHSQ